MDADVTILGAGPVGSTLALLLARLTPTPRRIVLCRAPADGRSDPRVLALNHGSRVLLEELGVWPAGAGIHTIHVSQRGRLGRTRLTREEFNVPELGTVVGYERLRHVLDAAVDASGVTVRTTPATAPATVAEDQPDPAAGLDLLQAGERWRSGVVVQAEGGTFDTQAVQTVRRDYGQHAVIATVLVSRPQPHVAWERFTREGPIALLPHPGDGHADPARLSLVWCSTPDQAEHLCTLSDAAFCEALHEAFGDRLGRFTLAGPRARFPLGVNLRTQIVDGRKVAIGNAAQTLHPVAGQGLNLGLRDAARLAQSLGDWLRDPASDPAPVLSGFARARLPDRWITTALTDLMPRVFTTGIPLVEHACGLALLALDSAFTMRAPLARQLMHGRRG